jgi:hypothetical protein
MTTQIAPIWQPIMRQLPQARGAAPSGQRSAMSGMRGGKPLSQRRLGEVIEGLHAVVLLAGSVRPPPLLRMTGRAIADLPVSDRMSILDLWHERVRSMADALDWRRPVLDVLCCRHAPPPGLRNRMDRPVMVRIRRDPGALRGTGGVLRDYCADLDDREWVLALNALQLPTEPLEDALMALASAGSDVALTAPVDGRPPSAFLIRCGALQAVAPLGYVDLKEQALEQVARRFDVRVVQRPCAGGIGIHTAQTYLDALRAFHGLEAAVLAVAESSVEPTAGVAVIESGARVGRGALLHDAVALNGCQIGEGAAIVRSIVAGSAVVRRGAVVVDRVVGPGERL